MLVVFTYATANYYFLLTVDFFAREVLCLMQLLALALGTDKKSEDSGFRAIHHLSLSGTYFPYFYKW